MARSAATLALALGALAGWSLLGGSVGAVLLAEHTGAASPAFLVGAVVTLVALRGGDALRARHGWSERSTGARAGLAVPARVVLADGSYVRARAAEAHVPASVVLAATWTPWWLLGVGWAALAVHALVKLA